MVDKTLSPLSFLGVVNVLKVSVDWMKLKFQLKLCGPGRAVDGAPEAGVAEAGHSLPLPPPAAL